MQRYRNPIGSKCYCQNQSYTPQYQQVLQARDEVLFDGPGFIQAQNRWHWETLPKEPKEIQTNVEIAENTVSEPSMEIKTYVKTTETNSNKTYKDATTDCGQLGDTMDNMSNYIQHLEETNKELKTHKAMLDSIENIVFNTRERWKTRKYFVFVFGFTSFLQVFQHKIQTYKLKQNNTKRRIFQHKSQHTIKFQNNLT